jgi:hypothetical protein
MDHSMTDEHITWSHEVRCGSSVHDVIFAASPWGIKIRLNPCSRIPKFLEYRGAERCDNASLEFDGTLAFQEAWFELPQKERSIGRFPDQVLSRLQYWRENQVEFAAKVAKRYCAAYSLDDLPTMWARLTLLSARKGFPDESVAEIWSSQTNRGPMVSYLAADISLSNSNTSYIGETILEFSKCAIHPVLRSRLESKLAKIGTPNALICLMRLLRAAPAELSLRQATIECLAQLRKTMSAEQTLKLAMQAMIDCKMLHEKHWKNWYAIFDSLDFGSGRIMRELIEEANKDALQPLLYIALSEQCLQKKGDDFLAQIMSSVIKRRGEIHPALIDHQPVVQNYDRVKRLLEFFKII